MLSAILFINQKGEVVISRSYRDDVARTVGDHFRLEIIAAKETTNPVVRIGDTSFCYIRHENLYIVAVTKSNVNAALVMEYMKQLIYLFRQYFPHGFDENAIRENFVLIYELLDECMDFGYPQNMSADVLKLYIMHGQMKKIQDKSGSGEASNITIQATGKIQWRREGIKYRKNEVFLDVVESVNLMMSAKGNILRQDVSGQILMKCFLSGMPECKFGINDKILMDNEESSRESKAPANAKKPNQAIQLDDVTFHQCVRLTTFDTDRSVSFIPPDGEFELMKYRITDNIRLPFRVLPNVKELGRTRLEVKVAVKSTFEADKFATKVICRIPCPPNTASCQITVGSGKAKYDPENHHIVWKMHRFGGGQEFQLSAMVSLTSTVSEKKAWSRPPIAMEFNVPMFTASGMQVRYLRVIEKNIPHAIKWVRYITKAGTYEIRI